VRYRTVDSRKIIQTQNSYTEQPAENRALTLLSPKYFGEPTHSFVGNDHQ
jgi:hypothetical protein